MAGACEVEVKLLMTGLGDNVKLYEDFDVTTTPTAYTKIYKTLTTADTAEVLGLGDVSTVSLIYIKAVDGILYVDTSYVSSFVNEITIPEGEVAVFKPAGTVYVKNGTAAETPIFEYIVIGTT